jgi:hypothetical protein
MKTLSWNLVQALYPLSHGCCGKPVMIEELLMEEKARQKYQCSMLEELGLQLPPALGEKSRVWKQQYAKNSFSAQLLLNFALKLHRAFCHRTSSYHK